MLISAFSAKAGDWRVVVQRAGFLGTIAAGAGYDFTEHHGIEFSIGTFPIAEKSYYQSNFIYRYSHWNTPVEGHMWKPIQVGVFLVLAMADGKYFITSPDKYPYAKYYDETALRYGAELGTSFTFAVTRIGLGYYIRVFDNGLIAAFNNSNRDLQYYVSSGFNLSYTF
ncbi:MAG: hypothetical protein J7501_07225 [Bdellovibrio sp.]|nr:hypothetical protein [Bdellovibrio sp.]